VLCAALRERFKNWVPYLWFCQFPLGHPQIELSEVLAVQMADQIT
jgi:hypothetical protein